MNSSDHRRQRADGRPERYGDVVFSQDRSDEAERLSAIAETYDHVSWRQILDLNPQSGWRCLDAGAGPGTISAWLAAEVPDSQVIAADRDVRLVGTLAASHDNLKAVQMDLSDSAALAELGKFDLVIARFVLMHHRDREELLRDFAGSLAPGGWLVLSDSIDLTASVSPLTPYRKVMSAMWRVLRSTIGSDITWVPTGPALMRDQGLCNISSEVHLPSVHHGSPVAKFWRITWDQMSERLAASEGIDDAVLATAMAQLEDPAFTALSPGMITTIGRRSVD
ncbi:methyltransferase domain-containing protein [Streptomyces sp. b94]|uniref:class I SAM-dependent methyltransferase n=1 Tax=Streptomyces sp. b94 TaxID=1827634 RepID=UPI001B36F69A|nr:class I SAM-dependent methyltransferase [Streptomyces sp. b94]MBQ1101255.1 methyltransferase domain-containing protein [Streptomyces sp. b94]